MARIKPTRFGHADPSGEQIRPGSVIRQYTEAEAQALATEWLAVFGANAHTVNTNAFLWHVFSADCYPCISGAAAIDAYQQQSGVEFVVLSNDRLLAFVTDTLPESSSLSDYYVFPPNMAWTMCFTHEDGLDGTYFARHPEWEQLEQINQSASQKSREKQKHGTKGTGERPLRND
jgi:hypothetical protein